MQKSHENIGKLRVILFFRTRKKQVAKVIV